MNTASFANMARKKSLPRMMVDSGFCLYKRSVVEGYRRTTRGRRGSAAKQLPPGLLTAREAAFRLGMHVDSVYAARYAGRINTEIVNGLIAVTAEEVERYRREHPRRY
jgi:hypothetical protein